MQRLSIRGGKKLTGSVQAKGAKNAALPILFATLLTDQECLIQNIPHLVDITTTLKILKQMGVNAQYDSRSKTAALAAQKITNPVAPYELVRTMRASVLVLGPLLARFGEAKVSLPGGCSIGARPVNLHLMALEKMGATIEIKEGYIFAKCKTLRGAEIKFPQVSVGATENTLMAAALAQGTTVIQNAAQEPEITDLAHMLGTMGVKIKGAGTPTIEITGASRVSGASHSVVADRIEAGTYLIAGAITGGDVTVTGANENLMSALLEKLRETGCKVDGKADSIRLQAPPTCTAANVSTEPFPGFATDMQAQFMALMTLARGTSEITETIFENRFMHVAELQRLGADITVTGNKAVVRGLGGTGRTLSGASVMATDLRASACLVLAGLAARGTTSVRRIYHLDRGYERMEENLRALGADITREPGTEDT